ncbi:diaminopimelate epimerase [Synechococcus sp. JA-3-3Ab]|uniref:Diaminopimelate epimerase n=1 Tax=Synechococcus sp. (strain JA-3-3Ab) TaxID=321327 RepID=DAPF_SYNJA|nr:RecName: Full=Diaminopimelate epimerase; Short=DAP epimerase; AltName: Full=PLP-independent amino acid racemase [Synechococcus sp. JA-3-3Ab]ABC99501.1 diaminopimelate epimerase [Synechococcus sp. JA-3-3Ab]
MPSRLSFHKYQGLGNDFILVDNRHQPQPCLTPEEAVALCNRRFGVGADGVIFLLPGQEGADFSMRLFNSDGSEAEMCGNGIRCLARFLQDLGIPGQDGAYQIHTLAGRIVPQVRPDGLVTVDMGIPRLLAGQIPTTLAKPEEKVVRQPLQVGGREWAVTAVSMGNPHCVVFLEEGGSLEELDLERVGPLFEHHPAFPERTNTEFAQVLGPNYLRLRVWERGAGVTLACGTGACAALVAAVLEERAEPQATVELPGGNLEIRWDPDTQHVWMTGPALPVFSGTTAE